MVFFVLSGYVIAYTAAHKDRTAGAYAASRLARLYSVVVPALALGVVLDAAGSALAPALYADHWSDPATAANLAAPAALQLLASGSFLNQVWTADLTPPTNSPFWSLGYEAPYYAIFAAATYLSGRMRLAALVALALAAGPKILLLLPIWLLGVGLYRLGETWRPTAPEGWLMAGAAIAGYAGFAASGLIARLAAWPAGWLGPGAEPLLGSSAAFPANYVTGALFGLLLVGLSGVADRLAPLLAPLARPIRALAGLTFTLYLLHYPLIYCLRAVVLALHVEPLSPLLVTGGTVAAVAALAPLTEGRKHQLRRLFARLSGRLAEQARTG